VSKTLTVFKKPTSTQSKSTYCRFRESQHCWLSVCTVLLLLVRLFSPEIKVGKRQSWINGRLEWQIHGFYTGKWTRIARLDLGIRNRALAPFPSKSNSRWTCTRSTIWTAGQACSFGRECAKLYDCTSL
jgi:hypothetical protein